MVGPDVLLSMSRAELVARAASLGIERADRLTRPELRDEILRRTKTGGEADVARGFFGIARSMLASMMETGLKMPEAAALIRGTQTLSAQVSAGPPVATVTLAEIYSAQGHPDRALAMVERVLESEPDHLEAQRLRERLLREQSFREPGLALRAEPQTQVLETTGEEIRTGEPPPVQAAPEVPREVAREVEAAPEVEPAAPPAEAAPGSEPLRVAAPASEVASLEQVEPEPAPARPEGATQTTAAVRPEIRLSASGSDLALEWAWPGDEQATAGTPTIVVFAFHGRAGRPNAEQARIPLELGAPGAPSSGMLHLAGFAGAAVSASIGLIEDDVFVPRQQALLHREKWSRDAERPSLDEA